MLKFAIFIGIYSYIIFAIGLLKLIYPFPVALLSIIVWGIFLFLVRHDLANLTKLKFKTSKWKKFYIFLIVILLLVNFIGTLGPELAFDALWYHLTIPKIFIGHNSVFYIKNSLFYYSLMPKLGEMLYTPAIMLGGETLAKIVHYSFGIFTAIVIYKMIRLYLKREWALIGVIIFLSNLVVSWMMITSYIDLIRAFFEAYAFYYLLIFTKNKKNINLLVSALLLGFAISTKLVSLTSLFVYLPVIFYVCRKNLNSAFKKTLLFFFVSLLVPLPYFLFSLLQTGNPFFPVFSSYAPHAFSLRNLFPLNFLTNIVNVFLFSPDPVNPIYIIALPIIFLTSKTKNIKIPFILVILSLFFWYLATFLGLWQATDSAGSSRFLISYFPGFILLTILAVDNLKDDFLKKAFLFIVIFLSLTTIFYRLAANIRFFPVILGVESKENFLMKNLNFSFGDFFDEGQNIKNIVGNRPVLVDGIHNLYYADFNFTLRGWSDEKNAKYLLVQGSSSTNKTLLYKNSKTNVKLYKL